MKIIEEKEIPPLERKKAEEHTHLLCGNTIRKESFRGQVKEIKMIAFRPDYNLTVEKLENGVQRWTGLDSDTKPTSPPVGSTFHETNTGQDA